MSTSDICILIAIVVYLLLVVGVGFRFFKKNSSPSEFYLGGRKLGPLVTAMSAEASDMSSYLLMGLPGLAYLSGVADVGWTCIGLAIGTYLNWLLTARRLRRYTVKTDSYTLPQFFSNRYRDKKNILSIIAALIIILFFIPYTASGFSACGKLFHSLFGWDYMPTMIISAIIIVFYTTAGGFMAASTTDFIQSIVMTIAIFTVLIFATVKAGGIGAVSENIKTLPGFLSLTETFSAETGSGAPYTLLMIITTMSWG
ncbi:MAG: sodium:proline symporter, partial [Lachnospiraceae bacterium]|nr:sodium:proline symporter [Lachnospiraceae bacterium]